MTIAASLSEPSSPRLKFIDAEDEGTTIFENYSSKGTK
jgi:hypothetical protein